MKEKKKEVTEEELNKYRKPVYNEQVTCLGLEVRYKPNKTQIALLLENDKEITYKLEKEKKVETYNEELFINEKETETEVVTKSELNKHLPQIFKDIAKHIKENGSIVLNVSYSQSALAFDDEIVVYKYMRKYHVDTIYSKSIHKDDERLQKQIIQADKYEQRKKGEKQTL